MSMRFPSDILYSRKYKDITHQYRTVTLTKVAYQRRKKIPRHLLEEHEWRGIGIQQSRGWEHTGQFDEEPNVLGFRRLLGTNPETGSPPKKVISEF